ncbi:apolipoprotein B-100-like [Xyrauchen texanus]|uniref:apolipoprotein B-100-like n=1 Tax=Xyrauchen texanus TaxID=154827 RepID=UPI002241AC8A|nr:apolipoprotein B-100-like [Xyrauchen texanus]
MGDNKLCLFMLLNIFALSKAENGEAPCLMVKRYKLFHKYEYLYEAESLNALNGAVNGPKFSCKVEIEVPGTCRYIMHTTDCTLSEVTDVDANRNPVFGPAVDAEKFKAEMKRHTLKFTIEGDNEIKLFPEQNELINILNIKRGIVSALAVPLLEEEKNKDMPTIYGLCKTDYIVNTRQDIPTDITLKRDLSRCDKFRPVKDHTSPLALISGMHYPLAHLIRSTQTCNYKFDNEKHHMTSGACTEKHVLVPFSHKKESGVTNIGKQKLNLLGVTENSNRVFYHKVANMKPLHVDSSVDMSPIQDKDVALDVLKELAHLSKTTNGHKRAHLAHKLVSVIRKMNAETLTAAVPEALEISRSLTYQVLLQCGTPECNSVIMQIYRTFDKSSVEIDAVVYAMGMVPHPSRVLVKEMLEMAQYKPSKPIYYAVSNAVRRLYEAEGLSREIQAVADYAIEQMGDCTGDQEHIFLSLRVIGNMGAAMGAASPSLKSAVIECINQPAASPEVQQAAIQVFRQTSVPEEGRKVLLHVVLDRAAPIQKRVAAYLILMKNPESAELAQLATALHAEENLQAKSFFISHITNILSFTTPETLEFRQKVAEAFVDNNIGTVMDPTQFSRNYRFGSLEGNMIIESPNELPREVMLEMALTAFGFDMDFVEIGLEGKGFEPFVEALFGDNGFFPDTVMKTIFYAADKMPQQLNGLLKNVLPILRNDRKKRQATQSIVREISHNVNKLFRDLKAQDAPEAMVYLRLLGAELGYLKTKDMEDMVYSAGKMIDNLLKMIHTDFIRSLYSSADNELFLHYIFMDNEFFLPTSPGFPLRVALSGTFTPGIKGGLNFNPFTSEFAFMPSAGIEIVTEVGAHFPDYVHSGLEMHTNIYHESGLRAKVSICKNQVTLTIPAPQGPTKLISVTNSLVSAVGTKTKIIPAMGEHTDEEECNRFVPGLKYCSVLQYSDAMSNDNAPYFPLTGDSKFAIELHPTGEVTEYSTTINYIFEDDGDKGTFRVEVEEIFIPESMSLSVPTFGIVSGKISSNFYNLEAAVSAGRDAVAHPSYSAKVKVNGTSSVDLFSIKFEGSALVEAKPDNSFKANAKTEVIHRLFNASISVEEEVKIAENVSVKSNSKLDVTSPVGVQMSLEHIGKVGANADEISGDSNLEGSFKAGQVHGSVALVQTVSLFPFKPEAKIDSSLKIDLAPLRAQNIIAAAFANGELSILSKTAAFEDLLTNIAEMTFKESQLTLRSDTKALASGLNIKNTAEARAEVRAVNIKIETSADLFSERIHSLITGALDISGLNIHSDASAYLTGHKAAHNANLTLNQDGLATSGTTSLQSLFTHEELKHTYKISYKSLTATAHCRTDGYMKGTRIRHNTKMEIAGLAVIFIHDAHLISETFGFDSTIRGTGVPFRFHFDAITNANGVIYLYGRQEAKIHTKFLLKAQPLAIAHTHDCKVSTTHKLDNGVYIETNLNNKADTLLTPFEQTTTVIVKSKVNNHAMNQEINAYSTPERLGLVVSGTVLTNLFNNANADNQDFSVSGFLKYDKNSDGHVINLPVIDNLPAVFDNIRSTLVSMGEAMRNYINREEIAANLQNLPQYVNNLITEMDFKGRVVQLKDSFLAALKSEVDKKIEAVQDAVVELIKQFQLDEKVNIWTSHLKSIQVCVSQFLDDTVTYLRMKHFEQVIEDLNEISLSTTKFSAEHMLDIPLQIPQIKFPAIPKALVVPYFGKLYSEVRVSSPVYSFRTSAEFRKASEEHSLFTCFLTSQGASANNANINYNLDSKVQIYIPKLSNVTVSETFNLTHTGMTLNQQASLALKAFASEASAERIPTNNPTHSSMKDGISFSLETSYNHQLSIPLLSLTSEATLTQKAVARKGTTITITVANEGTGKFALPDFSDEGTHKSDLQFDMDLSTARLTLTGHTDSDLLKMKMTVNADAVVLSHLEFSARVENESPFIKNSLVVASGKAHLGDMKVEVKAAHDAEFVGAVSGSLSNTVNIMAHPSEVVIDFQNKGNTKISLYEALSAEIDLQNDNAVTLNTDIQQISTVALARFNQYKYSHNFTLVNNKAETGIYAVVNGEANLETSNVLETFVPALNVVKDLISYSHTDLWHVLTNTDQAIDLDAKLVYQKRVALVTDMGFIIVPSLGNLISKVSFKSSILTLNSNAGIYQEDNFVMCVSATTASVFEELKAKLNASTTLTTTESGLKLANALSLENAHVAGTHESTVTLEIDNYEAVLSMDTDANINLLNLTFEATHQLSADNKAIPKAVSALKVKYAFDRPDSKAVGHGDFENTLKLEATLFLISIELATNVTTDNNISNASVQVTLENYATIYVKSDGLQSTVKTTGNGKIDHAYSNLGFDINDRLTLEGNLIRVHSVLERDTSCDISLHQDFNIKMNHTALAKMDLIPLTSLMAAVDMYLSHPSYNDFDERDEEFIFSRDSVKLKSKTFSPWYNSSTVLSADAFGEYHKLNFDLEGSYNLTSPSALLEYEFDMHGLLTRDTSELA